MATTQKPLTPETAVRHEALYLKLSTLLRQTEAGANKRADAPVGDITRRLAEDLLFEARRFTIGPKAIPAAAPDLVGLATQLGQALAALEGYEARHAFWDEKVKCFVWSLPEQQTLPIARLKPKTAPAPERETAEETRIRARLAKLIQAKQEERYEQGHRDGMIEATRAIAAAQAENGDATYPRVQNPA